MYTYSTFMYMLGKIQGSPLASSGLEPLTVTLRQTYRDYDAEHKFQVTDIQAQESPLCRSGDVLRGAIKPTQCAAFGKECTPRHPLGATMVSSEGACAAYYNYGRFISAEELTNA